jgi:hypothetical protein
MDFFNNINKNILHTSLLIIIILLLITLIGILIYKTKRPIDKYTHTSWNTRDWIWLIIFMIYAQLFFFVKYSQFMTLISYVSTFVSTALAGVAIYISVREATKADKVKEEIYVLLGELKEKVGQVDTKLNNFDPHIYNNQKDTAIETSLNNLKNEILQALSDNVFEVAIKDEKTQSDGDKHHQTEVVQDSSTSNNQEVENELKFNYWKSILENKFEKVSDDLKSQLTVRNINTNINEVLKELDNHLSDTVGKQIRIALRKEDIGILEEKFKLIEYQINYNSRELLLVLEKDGNIYYKEFSPINDVKYSELSNGELKVWIYMDNFINWRFYLLKK